MFYFEKILSTFLTPPGIIIVILLVAGLISLKRASGSYQKTLAYIVVLTTLFLYLLSTGIGTILYVKPLEQAYSTPSLDLLQDHDAIVVLGGGIVLGNEEVELGPHTLKRLLKGFELYKKFGKPIVLTGGSPLGRDSLTEAEVMAKVLKEWGVEDKDIIIDKSARTTAENAFEVSKILHTKNWNRVILVTSAVHMKRAVNAFQRNGIVVTPYPMDYLYDYAPLSWVDFLPGKDPLEANLMGIHEFIGQIWYRIRSR
ncbi:hypothetical protein AT15_05010 [Kosmotoga arenicorallina S304]|uniref:DUF218 domain-containing protein n=1 Tax=Kosmotoga arenicorallina S304 TaxID=1453497 RepID=A0A176JVF7_9BACT|nr:YdcF family protein [Kosmotoga arenicorallina]OAA27579.1 hypothetical protein AT15_05010 [Kosmotoga arenicorallina S304]